MEVETLATIWDVWCFHGIEPDDEFKREVEKLGFSAAGEDRGNTKRQLMYACPVPSWLINPSEIPMVAQCQNCGARYGSEWMIGEFCNACGGGRVGELNAN